ncbi:TIGR00282 family metallophosphoesterase [symbiont of Argiope bruennichi]|uniref:TIGR00282 family metallophosphoesterase n=1 Tax=symbiont of Argiope bruennichi TaxID=2810479 RepID=UPI003DA2E693
MNILVIGDLSGNSGKKALETYLPLIKEKYKINFIIVNAENTTNGKSLSIKDYNFLKSLKVDAITMGNHTFFRDDMKELLTKKKDIIRPINFSRYAPGNGTLLINKNSVLVRVTNVIGKTFITDSDNPYPIFDDLLKSIEGENSIHIIDFHGETTSEKIAFALNYDGKISALVGTHTHVQTADEKILPNGTGFITDIGMTGSYYSILGAKSENIIFRLKTGLFTKFTTDDGPAQFCAIYLKVDEKTKKTLDIKRIFITPEKNFF